MTIRKLVVEFASVFALALVTAGLATLLWNLLARAEGMVDWETAFVLAMLFGTIQTWAKAREIKWG